MRASSLFLVRSREILRHQLLANRIAFTFFAVSSLIWCGCRVDLHPIPRNADPNEKDAVAALKPLAENLGWNGQGRVWSMDLGGGHITDAELRHVQQLLDLQFLALGGSQITDEGLKQLKPLQKLLGLSLQWTPITDSGLVHLQDLSSLTTLDLNYTRISDAGLEHLYELPELKTLFIEGTQVTDEGVERFQEARPQCRVQR